MWSCQDRLKRKTSHFRLPFVAQKRRVPKLPWLAPDVIAAMLVYWTIAKKSFGNLALLLCKTQATFCFCFVHQHGRLLTWVQAKKIKESAFRWRHVGHVEAVKYPFRLHFYILPFVLVCTYGSRSQERTHSITRDKLFTNSLYPSFIG